MFEKTMNELTNSYLKKHEELLKEENDLKIYCIRNLLLGNFKN